MSWPRKQMDGDGFTHKPIFGRSVLASMRTGMRVVKHLPPLKKRMTDAQQRYRGADREDLPRHGGVSRSRKSRANDRTIERGKEVKVPKRNDDQGQRFAAGGLAFLGCIITAAGVGWLLGPTYILPGALIGLGFLALAAFYPRSSS